MNVTFDEKTIPCRKVTVGGGFLKPGDFTLYQGQMCKIVTVQSECFDWSLHQFVMATLETREHEIIPLRSPGKRDVFRPVR